MSENFGDQPSPEKEDAVREALGVEKMYVVSLCIPTIGQVKMGDIHVIAINADEAEEKAKELWFSTCDVGIEPEEANHDYAYDDDTNNWQADVEEA